MYSTNLFVTDFLLILTQNISWAAQFWQFFFMLGFRNTIFFEYYVHMKRLKIRFEFVYLTFNCMNPIFYGILKQELTANCFWSNSVLTNYFGLVFRHHLLWILSIIWWYWKKAEKIEWIGLVKSCSLYIGLHVQKALVNPACNSHSIQDRISHSTQASLPIHSTSLPEYSVRFLIILCWHLWVTHI